jgi:GTP-binding protein
MNFIDTAKVFAKAGGGGDGCLSFHREKYVPYGGPDGGNGGKGGDIWLVADRNITTLLDFARNPHLFAKSGENGKGSNKHGRSADDLVVRVPMGTAVHRGGSLIADLSVDGQKLLAARGGRGGRGNASFKTISNTAPRIAMKGEPGEDVELDLELKLLADVGLVGLPNAGKSTFLSRVSNAHPKIADYPFTTLAPMLGLVKHREKSFVLADIPGLIEGAHEGKGLGIEFLRHVERTRVLIHLVDPLGFQKVGADESVKVIENELKAFGHGLDKKPRVLVVHKADLPEAEAVWKKLKRKRKGVLLASAVTGKGIPAVLDAALKALAKAPVPEVAPPAEDEESDVHVFKMEAGFTVRKLSDRLYQVEGKNVEKLARTTNFGQPEAVTRFQNILKKMGVDRELKSQGVRPGDTVRVSTVELEWQDQAPEAERPATGGRRAKYLERRAAKRAAMDAADEEDQRS